MQLETAEIIRQSIDSEFPSLLNSLIAGFAVADLSPFWLFYLRIAFGQSHSIAFVNVAIYDMGHHCFRTSFLFAALELSYFPIAYSTILESDLAIC